jgi:hypothetical protein
MYYKKSLYGGEFFTEAFTVWRNEKLHNSEWRWLIVFFEEINL